MLGSEREGRAMNLSEQAPTQIDAALADLYRQINRLRARRDSTYAHVAHEIGRYVYGRGFRDTTTPNEVRETLTEWDETPSSNLPPYATAILRYWDRYISECDQVDAAVEAQQPYDEEYRNRGRWSRFFLTQATNGHIHSSMDCSTCNNGTAPTHVASLPELSGQTEQEAVTAQGALLCTTCYPNAPAEWTNNYEQQTEAKKAAQCPG